MIDIKTDSVTNLHTNDAFKSGIILTILAKDMLSPHPY